MLWFDIFLDFIDSSERWAGSPEGGRALARTGRRWKDTFLGGFESESGRRGSGVVDRDCCEAYLLEPTELMMRLRMRLGGCWGAQADWNWRELKVKRSSIDRTLMK